MSDHPALQVVTGCGPVTGTAVAVAAGAIDGSLALDDALRRTVEHLLAHRRVEIVTAVLTRFTPDAPAAWLRLGERAWVREWTAEGSTRTLLPPPGAGPEAALTMPWLSQLARTGIVALTDRELLPPEAEVDRDELVRAEVRSLVAATFTSRGEMFGSMSLVSPEAGAWPEQLIDDFRLLNAAPTPQATSRFADRFAPPRPPTRQMNQMLIDITRSPQKSDPALANAWKSKSGRDLTEDELLAMPDSEYMNEKQLDFFRARLQALKDDLLSNAGETTEHLREDTSIVPDPADRATIEEEHALELRTRDRERKLLKKISQSLGRIEAGDYGFCDETGEPIGLGRLIARPTATLSLEAQQRRELKQKMFGD